MMVAQNYDMGATLAPLNLKLCTITGLWNKNATFDNVISCKM